MTLLHVSEDSTPSATRNRMEEFEADELRGVDVSPVITSGDPAARIVEFAEREGCDLIVMPTHGYGPVHRFVLGSVTAKVLESVKCPVWTVATSTWESSAAAVKHVLCGAYFDPSTSNTIRWAALFADAFGASLSVLSVLPPTPPNDVPESFVSDWNEGALPGLESRLKGLVQELGVKADILVDQGDTAMILLNVARSKKADLLVIVRRNGKSGQGRFGGNTYALIRHSPCPVVSV